MLTIQRPMKIMLICSGILFGSIFTYKAVMGVLFKKYVASYTDIVTVSAMEATYSTWQPELNFSANLRAAQGINITSEMAGLVQNIFFTPGAMAKKGDILVTLNADADIAKLHALQALSALANITYQRDKKLYSTGSLTKAQVDIDEADLNNKIAQVAEQTANIAKKTLFAPFSGKLGIANISTGQYVNPGNKIVTLQALDPIYADFFVPQQVLNQLKLGQPVEMTVDTFPDRIFKGKITTIEPLVDINTRNTQIEATIEDTQNKLLPGMFASVKIKTGKPMQYLTLPQTAISFNPYGNIVYVVKKADKTKKLTVLQTFVTTGPTRGDQIAILNGLTAGDTVVTSGQLKLRNNVAVSINNTIVPNHNPSPTIIDE